MSEDIDEILKALNISGNTYNNLIKEFKLDSAVNYASTLKFVKTPIKFVNKSKNPDPAYETSGSSGFDLRANLSDTIYLGAGDIMVIPTGLYFEFPENFELQVRPRSGLAAKHGVTVLNAPGTIDADYRGEILVILVNHGKNKFKIANGDRIAQGVLASVIASNIVQLTRTEEINTDTDRGEGGLGSTGIK